MAHVRCSDSGGRSGDHRIRIALLDVNDNAPTIAIALDFESSGSSVNVRGTGAQAPPRLSLVNASSSIYVLEIEEDDGGDKIALSDTKTGGSGPGSGAKAIRLSAPSERVLFRVIATDPDEGMSFFSIEPMNSCYCFDCILGKERRTLFLKLAY